MDDRQIEDGQRNCSIEKMRNSWEEEEEEKKSLNFSISMISNMVQSKKKKK